MEGDCGTSLVRRRARCVGWRPIAVALGVVVIALAVAPLALAESGKSPASTDERQAARQPVELWRAFPLGTAKLAPEKPSVPEKPSAPAVRPPATSAATSSAPAAEIVTPGSSSGIPTPVWYALIGLGVGLACGVVLLAVMSRVEARRGSEHVPAQARSRGSASARRPRRAEDMSIDLVSRVGAYHAQSGADAKPAGMAAANGASAEHAAMAAANGAPAEPVATTAASDSAEDRGQPEPVTSDEAVDRVRTAVLERTGHVLAAPVGQGYELFEVGGEPPTPGEVLDGNELGLGGQFTVDTIGPSPIDGDTRECAFLVRVA
jgi:pyruvate/2-oxoglutarate dehydrogenase complex dihydrolipoamide acyltransferase (E2) component